MVNPITERATCHCTVKVYLNGHLSLACDPVDGNLAIGGDGVFGLDLPAGMELPTLARRLTTMLPTLRLVEVLEPQASLASPIAAAPAPPQCLSLCRLARNSNATGTGNSNSDYTIRGESRIHIISRAS